MNRKMASSPTTLADIHPQIIQTHILPRLDGPSLAAAVSVSPFLHSLCTESDLWSDICNSTWPSISDPRVQAAISTFPAGHHSFFKDSFPSLIHHNHGYSRRWSTWQPHCPTCQKDRRPDLATPELISAVDIHYQNDLVYSRVEVTDTTVNFLDPALWIEFNDNPETTRPGPHPVPAVSRVIDLDANEDEATISHLKESVTLSWILIDPARKLACNLSSIKPVVVKKNWMTQEMQIRYVTVLPGCDPNEAVQCRIEVTWEAANGGGGLQVNGVILQIQDLETRCLTGREFLVITRGAIMEENDVRRKVVGDEERERRYKEFLEMRREKRDWIKCNEKQTQLVSKIRQFGVLMLVLLWIYFGILKA